MWDIERCEGFWRIKGPNVAVDFDAEGLAVRFDAWKAAQNSLPESIVPINSRFVPKTPYDKTVFDVLVSSTLYGVAAFMNLSDDYQSVYGDYLLTSCATILARGHGPALRHYVSRVRAGIQNPEDAWKMISRRVSVTWANFAEAKGNRSIREAIGRDFKGGLRTRRHDVEFGSHMGVFSNDWLSSVSDAGAQAMLERFEKAEGYTVGPLPFPTTAFISESHWQPYVVLMSEGQPPKMYFFVKDKWVHIPQDADFILPDEEDAYYDAIMSCLASLYAMTLPNVIVENAAGIRLSAGKPQKKSSREVVVRRLRPGRVVVSWGTQGSGSVKSPHMRRAHIRRLRDGRVVLVRSCAIHGGNNEIPPYAIDLRHSGGGIPASSLPT